MRGAGAEQISVLVRTVVESRASKNVLHYFYTLGYKLDHEILKIGFAFRFHRGALITVTVTSANKMPRLHATDEAVPVTPGIQLVEITAPAAADNYNDVVSAVTAFCEYLAPWVPLSLNSKTPIRRWIWMNQACFLLTLQAATSVKTRTFDWNCRNCWRRCCLAHVKWWWQNLVKWSCWMLRWSRAAAVLPYGWWCLWLVLFYAYPIGWPDVVPCSCTVSETYLSWYPLILVFLLTKSFSWRYLIAALVLK